MILSRKCGLAFLAGVAWLTLGEVARGAPVQIDSVKTTFHGGTEAELRECINGPDVNQGGWFVAPRSGEPQAAIFRLARPVDTAVDITLCFLSGRPDSFPLKLALSTTSDAQPSPAGQWQRVVPTSWEATGPKLFFEKDGNFRADGSAADAVFEFTVGRGQAPVTGFRLDVFPTVRPENLGGSGISSRRDGDFILTQFRVDALVPRTTNIALGRPVVSSQAVRFPAANLTDGLPGTFSHPENPESPGTFSFTIDLGTMRPLDHLALRNRADGNSPDRLSRIVIYLYDQPPGTTGARPVWRGRDRVDGSHPRPGEVDVIRAGDGEGTFAGRWVKLSSESPVGYSPEFAEVEIYGQIDLRPASFRADGAALPMTGMPSVPAGSRRLSLAMKLAPPGLPEDLPCRCRLRGYHTDWQSSQGLAVETACPPPGEYVFEGQVQHTDGQWNDRVLTVRFRVRPHFWQTAVFRWSFAGLAILGFAAGVRRFTKRRLARRMAALETRAALDGERARIAGDMHDEVGARLSQLAILQDIFAREHALSDAARAGMRQLAQTTRRVIASLDEVVWAVNPKNDTLASLAGYLEQCVTDYLGPIEIACRLDSPFEWPVIHVRAQVRHNLVLALREALQNILKHADATEATLRLRLEAGRFFLTLVDNGSGLPETCDGPGKDGLANMRARLVAIGGACEIRSRPEGGTEVAMSVTLKDEPGGIARESTDETIRVDPSAENRRTGLPPKDARDTSPRLCMLCGIGIALHPFPGSPPI